MQSKNLQTEKHYWYAAIFHCRFRSDNKALSPQQRRCGTTEKQPAIGNANIAQPLGASRYAVSTPTCTLKKTKPDDRKVFYEFEVYCMGF